MAPARPRHLLLLLLLLQLLCAVSLAALGLKGNKGVKDGVGFIQCLPGQYFVNGFCETCPKGTYMDHPNNATACKPCDIECGINEQLDDDYTSCSKERCRCSKGYCKDRDHPEGCYLCSRNHNDGVSGNVTSPEPAGTRDSGGHDHVTRTPPPVNPTGPQRETTVPHLPELTTEPSPTPSESAENWQRDRSIGIGLLSYLGLMPLAVLCFKKKGQVHNVGGSAPGIPPHPFQAP